jgi:hypothetical protein
MVAIFEKFLSEGNKKVSGQFSQVQYSIIIKNIMTVTLDYTISSHHHHHNISLR